jgi:hypothetical protein
MQSIVRNVRDIEETDRHALEHVIGRPLHATQQVIINVVDVDVASQAQGPALDRLPDWCNVYEGLSDEEIERIDRATSRRLDLTRSAE